MSKFDWEKRRKAEQPKEKRRVSNRSKVLAAYANGSKNERERIIKLLKPHAEHDEDMCYFEGKRECYPEDCSAPLIQWVIALIKGEK
jgi:hypothetical protein